MNVNNTALYLQVPQHTLALELSNNDRMVLSVLNDRNNLSKANGLTHNGRICLYYTRKAIAETVGLCEKTVIKAIKKLKMYGLIDEKRQGLGKANIIYLISPNASETVDTQQNCNFYTSRTEKSTTPELEKVQRNNNKLNNNKLNKDDDDDKYREDSSINNHQSSSINKEDINIFLEAYSKAMERDFILSTSQEIAITNLINKYGMDKVLKAVSHIEGNPYLLECNNPDKFVTYFVDIYNNKYIHWKFKDQKLEVPTIQMSTNTPEIKPIAKKTRFNSINSREWDFDELDRLEREYIDHKLAKYEEEKLSVGNVALNTVEQVVGTETVEQVMFAEPIEDVEKTAEEPDYSIDLTNFEMLSFEAECDLIVENPTKYKAYKVKADEYRRRKRLELIK